MYGACIGPVRGLYGAVQAARAACTVALAADASGDLPGLETGAVTAEPPRAASRGVPAFALWTAQSMLNRPALASARNAANAARPTTWAPSPGRLLSRRAVTPTRLAATSTQPGTANRARRAAPTLECRATRPRSTRAMAPTLVSQWDGVLIAPNGGPANAECLTIMLHNGVGRRFEEAGSTEQAVMLPDRFWQLPMV